MYIYIYILIHTVYARARYPIAMPPGGSGKRGARASPAEDVYTHTKQLRIKCQS